MLTTILVDDFEFFRNDVKAMSIWGDVSGFCVTVEAGNGRDALNLLREQPVDLLITDIRMPIIDGIELTQKVMEEKLCKCVILMSQFNDFDYARKGILYGAFEYLLKPVLEDELLMTLRRAAAYIAERNNELAKINYVDQILTRQAREHYPAEEFRLLVKSIGAADSDSAKIAVKILESVWFETDFDVLKSSYILNKVRKDFVDTVSNDYPWIKKLAVPPAAWDVDFTVFTGNEDLKQPFLDLVRQTKSIIMKFELDISNNNIIKTTCRYILENIDDKLSLKILSKRLFISSSYLSLLFKVKTGMNLIDYITIVKMERAKILLAGGTLKIYEIADTLGMSMEYFSKLFKKTYAVSPTKYRHLHIDSEK